MKTFVEVGSAVLTISDRRLYRATHSTFEDYIQDKWDMTARRAYQLCEAAEVVMKLENVKHASQIENARQAEALAKAPEEKRDEVLEKAIQTAPEGKLTSKHISETIIAVTSRTESISEQTEHGEAQAALGSKEIPPSSTLQSTIRKLNKIIDQALITFNTPQDLKKLWEEMDALSRKLQHPVVDV